MQDNRWMINRAGLVNFWYYDDETFEFSKGRLLLRGANGSGKSVTMQSFVPLLLDGNKSPERLDPFGSRARRIENYLLGDEENEKDDSIGYLYMEFKKKHSEHHVTIGLGFNARRGKPLKSWGFSVTDGRRIGVDFFLYKQLGEKIPLTMKELTNRIGDGGHVVDGQKNYMKLVNDLIFGFEELEEYDELVKLLVQLRSPKLSKDFKPTVIYEIMENSLQALSEEDLRPMSEAIENMDNIKSRLEELKESKGAADSIKQIFDRYNRFIIADKAGAFYENKMTLQDEKKLLFKTTEEIELSKKLNDSLKNEIERLNIEINAQQEKKRELEKHDSVVIRDKIMDLEKGLADITKQLKEKKQQHESKRSQESSLNNQIKEYSGAVEDVKEEITQKLDDMETISEYFAFDEHSFMMDELKKNLTHSYDFSYLEKTLKTQIQAINNGISAIEEEKKISKEYDSICMEIDKLKKEKTEKEKHLEQTEKLLLEIQEEYIEKLYTNNRENKEYIISHEGIIKLSREVKQFGPDSNFNSISQLMRQEYNQLEEIKKNKLYQEQSLRDNIHIEYSTKKDEITQWELMKDPQPYREEKVVKNREYLKSMGIPYIPLYKAVDFVDGLNDETKSSIEEALADMGILDALIIPKNCHEKIRNMEDKGGDKYIFASPKFMVHSLNQFLKVESSQEEIPEEEIMNVLNSVLMDENHHTYMDEKGNYSIGILKGRTNGEYNPKFIGTTTRKSYREQVLAQMGKELDAIKNRLEAKQEDIRKIQEEIEKLKGEYAQIPSGDDLLTSAHEVKNAVFEYRVIQNQLDKKNIDEKSLYEQLKKIKEKVYKITYRIPLTLDLEVYMEASKNAQEYKDELHILEKLTMKMQHQINVLKTNENRYEDILKDIDDILYDINILERRQISSETIMKNLNEQLKLTDYEAIRAELEQCLKDIEELPQIKEEKVIKRQKEISRSDRLAEDLAKLQSKIEEHEKICDVYEISFKEELDLGYVVKEPEQDILQTAKIIIRDYPVSDKQDKEYFTMKLLERFNDKSQYLREYSVSLDSSYDKDALDENSLGNIYSIKKRMDITAKVTGKTVNFYDLSSYLKDSLEETDKLLKESDRELFEDILVKNISKKISARIFHSERWVENMNKLMEQMDTSMGLSFSLRWSSKKAESEDQIDTKKLVDILKMDGNLMREEDLNALSQHFRSKIALARRALEDKNIQMTFHSIMKEILDYRKWFEFKLYYKKPGQKSKELTNNGFFQFSGGEKAMAMYVPLFSAVNARYEGARKDCARIISLDEAFAGVDEQNIRDMFRLLNDLGLSYIINSQNLWGDYDTVDSMSISELIRPENADFVTVLRYHWNGKVRKMVMESDA